MIRRPQFGVNGKHPVFFAKVVHRDYLRAIFNLLWMNNTHAPFNLENGTDAISKNAAALFFCYRGSCLS
jgi:hypothetical protein